VKLSSLVGRIVAFSSFFDREPCLSLTVEFEGLLVEKVRPRSIFISKSASANWTVTDLEKAEILQQIKDAEEKVRVATKEAENRRKQLQAEGKRKGIEKLEAAETAMRKERDSRVSDAKSRIETKKKALLDEGARKAEDLTSNARQRMGKAKEFVLTEFERAVDA